jgi:endoglucanase
VLYATDETSTDLVRALLPKLRLENAGENELPLQELTLRYYYTGDGVSGQSAECLWRHSGEEIQCATVSLMLREIVPPRQDADTLLEIGFSSEAGSLTPGVTSVEFRFSVRSEAVDVLFSQQNDYSFKPASGALTPNPAITVYRGGVVIAGVEPPPL